MSKIMFYINAIHDGGAERVMVNLAGELAEQGDTVILVTSFRDEWEYSISSKVRRLTLEKEREKSILRRNISRIKKLRKLCIDEKPNCLISFMAEPNVRALLATIGLPVKNIISVRNDPSKEYAGIIGFCIAKILLPFANGCVFQTEDAKMWFPLRLQNKSTLIYNAVKSDFFNTKRKPVSGKVITCGRLEAQKNHNLLISAFQNVHKTCPNAYLQVYGEGTLRMDLQTLIDDLGLKDVVSLCGISNNIPEILSEAAVFVLSSDYEGMPNALMEALAAGVPCVSTDCPCGGPEMLICNHENGVLVEPGNKEKLAKEIISILMDEDYAKKLSANARENAKNFSNDIIFEEWKKYIYNVIG